MHASLFLLGNKQSVLNTFSILVLVAVKFRTLANRTFLLYYYKLKTTPHSSLLTFAFGKRKHNIHCRFCYQYMSRMSQLWRQPSKLYNWLPRFPISTSLNCGMKIHLIHLNASFLMQQKQYRNNLNQLLSGIILTIRESM